MTVLRVALIALLILLFVGCSSEIPAPITPTVEVPTLNIEATVQARAAQELAAQPTDAPTAVPTATAIPTKVVLPTPTDLPTATPIPDPTPVPSAGDILARRSTPYPTSPTPSVLAVNVDPLDLLLPYDKLEFYTNTSIQWSDGYRANSSFIRYLQLEEPSIVSNEYVANASYKYMPDNVNQSLSLLDDWGRITGATITFTEHELVLDEGTIIGPMNDELTTIKIECGLYNRSEGAEYAFQNKTKDYEKRTTNTGHHTSMFHHRDKYADEGLSITTNKIWSPENDADFSGTWMPAIGDSTVKEKTEFINEKTSQGIAHITILFRSAYILCEISGVDRNFDNFSLQGPYYDQLGYSDQSSLINYVESVTRQLHERVNGLLQPRKGQPPLATRVPSINVDILESVYRGIYLKHYHENDKSTYFSESVPHEWVDDYHSIINETATILNEVLNTDIQHYPDLYLMGDIDSYDVVSKHLNISSFGFETAGFFRHPCPSNPYAPDTCHGGLYVKADSRLTRNKSIIAHEYSHSFIDEALDNRADILATWLNEGLAEWVQYKSTGENLARYNVESAAENGNLFPISSLESSRDWKQRSGTDVTLQYDQSGMLVTYLIEEYGGEKLFELITNSVRSGSVDFSMRKGIGIGYSEFESNFIEWLTTG